MFRKLILIPIAVLFFSSCATNHRKMLDERSGNEDPPSEQEVQFYGSGADGFQKSKVPVRTRPKVSAVYIYPHELPDNSYFWGAWLSVVTEEDQWILSVPNSVAPAPSFMNVTTQETVRNKKVE